ncbi:MAG TPA: DUF2497 domain-containing protein [Methyloceanibacter sp.]
MSSIERAPEPTMEEILASIRRIISDDESTSAKRSAAPQSQDDDEALELSEGEAEGEADDKIINDIARVLSGGAPAPVDAIEEEEDILDLTAELGGLEPVEEEVQAVELVAEAEAPAPEPEFLPEPQELEAEPEPVEEEAASLDAASPEPEVAAEPAQASQTMSASEEAASALERAIAALRAGQLPTSPIFSYEPPPFAAPVEPALEPVPEPAAQVPEPAFEPEGEPQLTLTEFEAEMVAQEPSILEVVVSEPEPEPERGWEPEVPPWAAREQPRTEPEYSAPRTNGNNHQTYGAASGGEAGPKSLEDSVKDMLRPMLQRWLDENMTRVLTSALKDELRDNPARFHED